MLPTISGYQGIARFFRRGGCLLVLFWSKPWFKHLRWSIWILLTWPWGLEFLGLLCAPRVIHRIFISWKASPLTFLNINFDDSIMDTSSKAGFVIRDLDSRLVAAGGNHFYRLLIPMAKLCIAWMDIIYGSWYFGRTVWWMKAILLLSLLDLVMCPESCYSPFVTWHHFFVSLGYFTGDLARLL